MNKNEYTDMVNMEDEHIDVVGIQEGIQTMDMMEHILNNTTSCHALLTVLVNNNLVTVEKFNEIRNNLRTKEKFYIDQYNSINTQRNALKSVLDMANLLNKASDNEDSLTDEERERVDKMINDEREAEAFTNDILNMIAPVTNVNIESVDCNK